ncbi:hypothetical protein [uncultured Tateyamaria sp.]|uniref:hypothetical protein n=1 Tax=uncultured Tateyamaria sp. TaxID=455651 RepID=UPI00260CD442|nr:hypothetical protein [uncultured Tateyamaria sp.]
MPRPVLITTASLVLVAALGGYWLGQRQLDLDATDVINAVAAQHVARHGGTVADCLGWAGTGQVVFQVRCGEIMYHVDRLGTVRIAPEDGI